ncbi:MAG TPA: IPT/TIG domain-containing protein [Dehalococcoidales bacterium]|nr:IPT/TIG domain-containing protein [Dehalococcoidales bacterium]
MKSGKIFRILAVVLLLPLLLVIIPGTPALAAPVLNVSPTSGAVGTMVTVVGENFDSYKGDDIFIYFDNDEITVIPITVPQTGSFSFDFNIPEGAEPGKHRIEVRSELGATLALSLFTVLAAKISLDPDDGVVGTELTVDGKGFYSDKVVTVYYDKRMLGTKAATATGEFSYSFTIPDSTAGEHTVLAKDAEGNSAEAEFKVIPSITLSSTSGAVGSILIISGKGFGSRNGLAVYFKYNEVAYAKTNELGNFASAFFNVPLMMPGTYDVTVEDEDKNMAKAEFAIVAGASIDKTTATVGSELTVSGTGFLVNSTITIEYDGVAFAQITADANGAFRAVLRVPVSQHGNHVITVSDGDSTRQLAFVMESEAPPVSAPLLPRGTSEVKAETHFDWEDVDDPSLPITYRFQVALDINFSSVVLEKKLTASEYTLTKEERLATVKKESPYYWRVKAIDGAANESEWSAPESFYVAAPPAPTLLLPEVDTKADSLVYFDWEDVTNLSPPMTYHLQVTSDKGFTSLVLEKKGLAKSEYAVTEEEKLASVKKELPYYWRVRAIDSVANEGEWSKSGSFYIAFTFPIWAIFTLIGLVALLVGFLAFWLGRRSAYSEP